MPTPYEDASGAVDRLGSNLNNIFVGLAQQRAQQQYLQQQMILRRLELQQRERESLRQQKMYDAHATLYDAQSLLARAKLKQEEQADTARALLREDLTDFPLMLEKQDELSGSIAGNLAMLPDADRRYLMQNAAQAFQLARPEMQPFIAMGDARRLYAPTTGPGEISVPAIPGIGPTIYNPGRVGAGQNLYAPQVSSANQGLEEAIASIAPQPPIASVPPRAGQTPQVSQLRALTELLQNLYNTRTFPGIPHDPAAAQALTNTTSLINQVLNAMGPQVNVMQGAYQGAPVVPIGPAAAPAASAITKGGKVIRVGEVYKGFQWLGGDPDKPESWRRVAQPRAGNTNEPAQLVLP